MEPISLAALAVGALGALTTGLASGAAQRVLSGTDQLVTLIRNRFSGDAGTIAILEEVQTRPTEAAQERLTLRLAQHIAADPEFAAALRRAVEGMGAVTVQAQDTGAIAGGDVHISGQYAAGRDLTIGRIDE